MLAGDSGQGKAVDVSFPAVCLGWEASRGSDLIITDSIVVIYCGVRSYHKTQRLKTANIQYLEPFLRVGNLAQQGSVVLA